MSQTLHSAGSGRVAPPVDPVAAHRGLRAATAAAHARTEALLDGPARCSRRDSYHELLQWFGVLHEVLEPVLRVIDRRVGGRLDTARRARLPWLHADLAALGGTPARRWAVSTRAAVRDLRADGVAEAIGLQYVLEGSTLGGRVLAAIAHRELGVDRDHGGRYLHGYGSATARRWQEWWQGLPGLVGDVDLPAVERSAQAAFAAFERAATGLAGSADGGGP